MYARISIIPCISCIFQSPLTQDPATVVRVAYAENIAQLAETALRYVRINPFMPNRLFYLNSLDRSISYIRGVWLVFIIMYLC